MIARNGCTSSHRIQRKREHIEDGFGAFVVNVAKMESGCALTLRLPINLQTFCSEKGHLLPNIRTSVKGDLMTDRILNKMHISHVSKDMALALRVYRLLHPARSSLHLHNRSHSVSFRDTPPPSLHAKLSLFDEINAFIGEALLCHRVFPQWIF